MPHSVYSTLAYKVVSVITPAVFQEAETMNDQGEDLKIKEFCYMAELGVGAWQADCSPQGFYQIHWAAAALQGHWKVPQMAT